ncbi:STX6 [Symbiodinium microadriaticum]|nr:STX6 [Symbiodinium microadriaticum]
MLLLLSVPFRLAILRRLISACLRPVVSEASTEVGPAGQAQTDEADLSRLGRASGFHSGFVRTDTDAAKMAWHLHSVLNQGCSADSGGSRNHVQSTSRACKERVSNVSMLERYLGVEALFFSWLTKVLLLTKKHGTLKAAFDKLDFFQDGRLSCLEWQEGLRQLLSTGSKESRRFDPLKDPRRTCDSVLLRLFKAMDKDKDGFISFDDLANAKGGPFVYARELRKKDTEEKLPVRSENCIAKGFERITQILSGALIQLQLNEFHAAAVGVTQERWKGAFAALLIKKFDTLDKAVLPPSGDEITTFGAEAKALHFTGNARSVFKELDRNNNGNISIQEFKVLRALNATEEREQVDESVARAELCKMASQWSGQPLPALVRHQVIERKQRSPIQDKRKKHMRKSLEELEKCTEQSAPRLHPDEIPGFAVVLAWSRMEHVILGVLTTVADALAFRLPIQKISRKSEGRFLRSELDNAVIQRWSFRVRFQQVMPDAHPLRGNKFKVTTDASSRMADKDIGLDLLRTFEPILHGARKQMSCPSHPDDKPIIKTCRGRCLNDPVDWEDMEHSAATFATYEGRMPRMSWKVDGTGASGAHFVSPAPWDKSRTLLKLKSHSESEIARTVMLSTSSDPFDVARDEVEAAVRKVRGMHKEWQRLLQNENTTESSRFKECHKDLLAELAQLSGDLAEVQQSIKAVEDNRDRFHLSDAQLATRKDFLAASQMAHQEINSSLSSAAVQNKFDEDRRQALLRNQRQAKETAERNLAQESKAFLEEQRLLQKQLLAQQEDELQALEKGAQRLGQVAYTINGEIESQQKLLDELNQDIEKEMERMDVVTKGMGALLKTSNKAQIYAVGGAIVLFVILVFLILNT